MPNLGPFEIICILVLVLVLFGPKKLPQLGSALGKTVKNVREGMEGSDQDDDAKEAEAEDVETVADEDDADVDADEAPAVFCSKCGAKNEADADFCSKCGAKLAE